MSAADLWKCCPNPTNEKARDAIAAELDLLASERAEKAFADFLASLYSKPTPFPLALEKTIFCDLHLLPLSSEARMALNADVTALGVSQAIKIIHPSRAPGLDGFSGLYYPKLSSLLLSHLTLYFNSMKQGDLPSPDSLRAHISMIPKSNEEAHNPRHSIQFPYLTKT